MNMALFVCPFVRLFATQDLTIDSSFFSDICVLGSRKVRKVKNPEDLSSQEGLKSPKNGTRISFLCFLQRSNPYALFLHECESTIGIIAFCKKLMSEKYGSCFMV